MAESIQKKLTRERPPRVKITYDVETGDAIAKTELPFIMGVIADLSGDWEEKRTQKTVLRDGKKEVVDLQWLDYGDRDFVEIDKDNFNDIMADFAPRVTVKLPQALCANAAAILSGCGKNECNKREQALKALYEIPTGFSGKSLALLPASSFTCAFNSMDDFKPDNIVQNSSALSPLLEFRNSLRDFYTKMDTNVNLKNMCAMFLNATVVNSGNCANTAELASLPVPTGDGEQTLAARGCCAKSAKGMGPCNPDSCKDASDLPTVYCGADCTKIIKLVTNANSYSIIGAYDKKPEGKYYRRVLASDMQNAISQSGIDMKNAVALTCYMSINREKLRNGLKQCYDNPIKLFIAETAKMDTALSAIMDTILHDPGFQRIEAAWRGLFHLVRNTSTGTGLRLKVFNTSKDDLKKDLTEAIDFDQSLLFKKVYEETYGTHGGNPYSCLLHDYYYDKSDDDIELLTQITAVAAAAHAPLLTAPAPGLFDLGSFKDLSAPRDLAKIFESAQHIKWNSFRELEDSRYLSMCLPHMMLRAPYVKTDVKSFEYEETLGADPTIPEHESYLWGNAAYGLGVCITQAFSLYGWTAAIRGMEGGGLVEGLPVHTYKRASGDMVTKIPTESAVTDRREKELSNLGFIALCYRLGTDKAVFFGGQTANKPIVYFEDDATANANLSARLPYMLNASRFAHYIKVIMRDKIGSFLDRDSIETYLNNWLSNYVLLNDNAKQRIKASYPLREGRVDVVEDLANPGAYRAIIYLRPHFQMEEIDVSIRLVATLPAPAA